MSSLLLDAVPDLRAASQRSAWRRSLAGDVTGGHSFLLVFRLVVLNLTGAALLAAAAMQGWIGQILAVDDTHICKLLFGLFLLGLVWTARRAVMLSRELNALEVGDLAGRTRIGRLRAAIHGMSEHGRSMMIGALRAKLVHRISPIRHMASSLVLIGLIGTIIGFIIALSGVDQAAAGDASQVGPMVATLLRGMSMALFKTLVGSILNIWLMINYRMLETAVVHLTTHLVEAEETDARA